MNIYDCFMYFDEDLLLDLRLNTLNKFVKKFIIVESKFLHSGKEKKLNFKIDNFSKFKDKITYIVVDDVPEGLFELSNKDNLETRNKKILGNSLLRENHQRNEINRGLMKADDESLILISDLDEIPNIEKFSYSKKISLFEQDVYYYKFNLRQPNFKWLGTRACKKKDLVSPQWLRNIKGKVYPFWRIDTVFSNKKYSNVKIINNGGWHYTSIKKPEDIFYKFSNYLHHLEFEESNLTLKEIEKIIKEKRIIYDHSISKRGKKHSATKYLEKIKNESLPKHIKENFDKFKEWLV